MKNLINLNVFISVVLLSLLNSCSKEEKSEMNNKTDNTENQTNENVTKAPSFSLRDTDNNQVKYSDFKDKVLVLFFFGNGCPSCIEAASTIQTKLADKFKSNSDFAIIGLDQWNGNLSSVKNFKSRTGVKFPLLLMASSTAREYKSTYDRLLVIDKKGFIQFSGKRNAINDIDKVVSITSTHLNK